MAPENSVPPAHGNGPSSPEAARPVTNPPQPAIITTVTAGMIIAGTYEIEQLINRGGMGEVYRGRNIHTGDPVALKIVLPALAHDPMIEALFQKEAKVLGRLAHDAIVRYHTYMNPPELGRPSLIMEFVEGTSLGDRIKQGPMPEAEVRVLMERLASGLDRAHKAGVVHRDLSPDNVILEGGQVEHAKLIDFGIAKSSMQGDRTLLQGQFAGKFSYVAPEQLGAYDGGIDGRTDIYSLALLMAAACQGKTVPMGGNMVEAVRSRSRVPDLAEVCPGLRPLLAHMLQPNPENRPASMAVVIEMMADPSLLRDPGSYASDDDAERTVVIAPPPVSATAERPQPPGEAFLGIPKPAAATVSAPAPKKPAGKAGLLGLVAVLGLVVVGGGVWMTGMFDGSSQPAPPVGNARQVPSAEPSTDASRAAEQEAARLAAAEKAARLQAEQAAAAEAARLAAAAAARDAEAARQEAARVAAEEAARGAAASAIQTQTDWLANFDAGPCVYFSPATVTGEKLSLDGFGTQTEPFAELVSDFRLEYGTEPEIGVRLINDQQCPVLDFMSGLKAPRDKAPRLILDSQSGILKSGETVSGRVEGLSGRAVSLFLVNGAGGATNLKDWQKRDGDDRIGFSFAVKLAEGAAPAPQLLLAVVTDQPIDKLDAVPNGVTARALVPFMQAELARLNQSATGDLRFFRLEN